MQKKKFSALFAAPKTLGLFVFYLCLCSCATITSNYQRIKVVSEPDGAEIIHEGKSIGFTPQYVQVKRRHHSELQLRFQNGETISYDMPTKYRWADSGASNLVWGLWTAGLLPVSYGVDFASQAAWEYKPLNTLQGSPQSKPVKTRSKVIAIAPPQSKYEVLSDELGERIERIVKERFPNDSVLSYRATAGIFERFDYSYKQVSPDKYRDDLYDELQADYVIESVSDNGGEIVLLTIDVNDVFREGTIMQLRRRLPVSELAFEKRGVFSKFFGSMSTLVPNTAGLDFSNSRPAVRVDSGDINKPFLSEKLADEGALQYLSSISLRSIRGNTYVNRFSFVFDWSTVVSVSYQNIKFQSETEPNPLKNYTYSWWNTQAGIGPQVGLSSPIGYYYLEVVPVLNSSFVSWRRAGNDYQVNSVFAGFRVEIGYSFFIGRSLNVRFASSTNSADERQWTSVVERSTGQRREVIGPNVISTGITIGYFFPEGRAVVRSLF